MQNLQKNLGLQKFSLNGTNRLVYGKSPEPDIKTMSDNAVKDAKNSLKIAFVPFRDNEWETKELITSLDLNDDQMFYLLKLLDTTCRNFLYKSLRPKYENAIERYSNSEKTGSLEQEISNETILKVAGDILLKINEFKKNKQEESSSEVTEAKSETARKVKEALSGETSAEGTKEELNSEDIKRAEESGKEKLAQGLDKYLKEQINDDALVQAVITEMAKTSEGKQILSKIQLIAYIELKKQILKSGVSLYTVKTGFEELRDVMNAFTDKLKEAKDNKKTNSVDEADKTAGSASTDAGASGEAKAENADVDTATGADEDSGVEEIEITREEEVREGGGEKPKKKEGWIKGFFKKIFNQKSSNGENQKPNAENLGEEEEMKSINKIPEELTKGKILTLRKMKEGQADGEPWVWVLENVDGIKLGANLQIGGETAGSVLFIKETEGVYLINAKWILYSFDPRKSKEAAQSETPAGETAQTEGETMSDEEVEEELDNILDEVIEEGDEEESRDGEVIDLEEEVGEENLNFAWPAIKLINLAEGMIEGLKNSKDVDEEEFTKANEELAKIKQKAQKLNPNAISSFDENHKVNTNTQKAVEGYLQEKIINNDFKKLKLILSTAKKEVDWALEVQAEFEKATSQIQTLTGELSELGGILYKKLKKLEIQKVNLGYLKDMAEIFGEADYQERIEKWTEKVAKLEAEKKEIEDKINAIRAKKEEITKDFV